MAGVDDHTEFGGKGPMPNTVYPKGTEALTASDKLRLQSITGQETDSRAQVDPYFWHGNVRPDPEEARQLERANREKWRKLRREEANRYKETPL